MADLLRVAAIGAVVLGHWVVAVVLERDGRIEAGQLLALVPETRALTWVFQVMPLFFFIGGYVNAGSWSRAASTGVTWTGWIGRRSSRLLRPVVPLLAVWLVIALLGERLGIPEDLLARGVETALLPVWFLAVYLIGIGLAPATLALHRRIGVWVIVGAVLATAVVDHVHLAGVPAVGFVNYVLVWAGVHQLGYLWFDRTFPLPARRHLQLAAATAVLLAGLLTLGRYPFSMVAVWGADQQNTDPPTVALWLFALTQINLVLAARGPLERGLRRDRTYGLVVLSGSIMLTVFLWHMTAYVVVATIAIVVPWWPLRSEIDGTWWAMEPLWLVAATAVLALLVAVFGRLERSTRAVPDVGRLRTLIGLTATVAGLSVIMVTGLYDPDRPTGVPPAPLAAFVLGLATLGILGPRRADGPSGRG